VPGDRARMTLLTLPRENFVRTEPLLRRTSENHTHASPRIHRPPVAATHTALVTTAPGIGTWSVRARRPVSLPPTLPLLSDSFSP